jgi:hydroxymethylpyrimidine/phosphomethylpyrimidine kinase
MIKKKEKTILVIAGHDTGGGAGLHADIKVANRLGVHVVSAVSALTVQNSVEVREVIPVSLKDVLKQIEVVVEDFEISVVKIGMVCDVRVLKGVLDYLGESLKGVPVVWDPVMRASVGGKEFLDLKGAKQVLQKLYLVTPNISEAERLSGLKIKNADDVRVAGEKILGMGVKNVLITGGHLIEDGKLVDYLFSESGELEFKSREIKTKNTHGSGCSLATAISCYLALGLEIKKSVKKGRKHVRRAIKNSYRLGKGAGCLG